MYCIVHTFKLAENHLPLTSTPHETHSSLTPQNKPQTPLIYDC